ncbi:MULTISPECIES: hypothetical protein [Cyanophyceae]|uniref:hypothetical protein n=1 Tax=Cyanophyceae TaxID=3028117 RepID=UPI00232FB859|nr:MULTISPECIES: hypothetical protein [Cyanophyceae]MDB9356519.1 hypothetical protein [Nodularia spumigena CS-587/03]MDB9341813.1 hypothetical protein [Nodularia spumigena CS-589/07]MDB9399467.1 hypothetical protein [Microcystis aeruginosa CS-567/02-A1]MDB9498457.1 hypothetical protein [Nodularia spumigena CS-336/02]MDB9532720.1 hypothetical protein [Nodularia spumigena CS-1038]
MAENIFRDFLKIQIGTLLLSKQLFNHYPHNSLGQLKIQDATTIFSEINSWIREPGGINTQALESILTHFLNLSKNYVISILSKNPDWRCLIGYQYSQEIAFFYSYHQFQEFNRQSILFRKTNNNSIKLLVEAIENIQPIIVDGKIADLLKNDQNISPVTCDVNSCKDILSKAPALAQPERRKQLLTELLKEVH